MIGTRVMDRVYRKMKERNGGIAQPEIRLILMVGPCFLVPTGMLIYGWTCVCHFVFECW